MTSRQLYEAALIELNKRKAPSLLLEDFVYFINKAVNQYENKKYTLYDINQQKTDDLSFLKATAILTPFRSTLYNSTVVYEVDLPDDYLHILNCVFEYTLQRPYNCLPVNSVIQQGARRATADMLSQIITNHYFKPSYVNPYYYINNVNLTNEFPTKDTKEDISQIINEGDVPIYRYSIKGNLPSTGTITITDEVTISTYT